MSHLSLWEIISQRDRNYPALSQDIEVDVAIVGAGITGITAAAELIAQGKKVAVLEASLVGGTTTGYSTGNLYVPVQPFYNTIESKFNFEIAKQVAHSRQAAIDYIEKNIQEKNINCHFHRRPWFAYTANGERIKLAKEVDLLKKMDIEIDYVHELPLPFKFKSAVVIKNQARLNPLQYVISMASHCAQKGCQIYENSCVLEFDEKDFCILKTEKGIVKSRKILLATHTPIGVNVTQTFTAPYRSYVVSIRVEDHNYPEGHFWDLDRPPHATCTHAETIGSNKPELIMVAGSHHKTGQGKPMIAHYQELEKFLRDHVKVSEVAYQWSAQHYQSADCVPYIGLASRFAKHTYMATGYWADGLIYGTIAGNIIANTILEKENPLQNTYDANRFKPFASSPFMLKENMNVLLQYLKDYPIFPQTDFTSIKKGEGKIVEINREKCAVSRDDNNELHIVSAVCTHMKCIIGWNNAEKTWDCPCHGSRFSQTGKVIEGPAILDLEKKH